MLQTKDLTKIYSGNKKPVKALNNLSLSFEAGNVYGIVGHNGAGKTTLIKLLCGLVFPTNGDVIINGSLLYPDNFKLLSKVGAILEGSRNIFWNLTPIQNIKYFSMLRGLNLKHAINLAKHYFKILELEDKIHTPVRNLSQGMKQKIAIIMSLLHNPDILLLDEPTLGLDPMSSQNMQQVIKNVAKNEKKVVIVTSHQLNIIQNISDYLVFLSQGSLRYFGSVSDFISETRISSYTVVVDNALKINELPFKEYIESIDEQDEKCFLKVNIKLDMLNDILVYFVSNNIKIYEIEKTSNSLEKVFLKRVNDDYF